MIQARVVNPGEIKFYSVPELTSKDLKSNEILLRIRRIGICGSDIHVMKGEHPLVSYPVIQGHEYAGDVIAIGKDVTEVKPGDKATARPQLVCGQCSPCRQGRYNVCQNLKVEGFQAPGAAQKYFIVSEDRIIKVDSSLSYDKIAMIEPCSVANHATSKVDLKGKNVVVTGAGMIGNLVAQFAIAKGAKNVLISDISDEKLAIARKCGIMHTVNTTTTSFEDATKELFGNDLFQIGFEVSAAQVCLTDLIKNIEKGGVVVVVSVFSKPALVNFSDVGEHELSVLGTMMYLHEDFVSSAKLISEKKLEIDPLVTRHFDFQAYNEAYAFIDEHKNISMRIMIDL